MSTLNVMIGEILVDKKVSKRTMVEFKDVPADEYRALIMQASFKADEMDAKAKAKHIQNYQEGLYDYGEVDNVIPLGHSPLDTLKMKNVALTSAQKSELVSQLTIDEKLYYGNWLNDNESFIESVPMEDDDLSFGDKTYEDGLEIFTNNKG